jgi:predicted flap endonuclease-1-like 5' DNA nuclease
MHRPRRSARCPASTCPLPAIVVSILVALVAVAIALLIGYATGRARARRGERVIAMPDRVSVPPAAPAPRTDTALHPIPRPAPPAPAVAESPDGAIAERARIIRSFEAETAMLRRGLATRDASVAQLADFAADRSRLYRELAASRGETARYRQLVVDLENDAPPPFFGTVAPDDLKLIVGVGPVLERMLQQLGITTYRQIALWTERDIDEFDAKLHEFPGRIRRDAWVTQARELHASKFGAPPSARDR